jgi:hypothetical protein
MVKFRLVIWHGKTRTPEWRFETPTTQVLADYYRYRCNAVSETHASTLYYLLEYGVNDPGFARWHPGDPLVTRREVIHYMATRASITQRRAYSANWVVGNVSIPERHRMHVDFSFTIV